MIKDLLHNHIVFGGAVSSSIGHFATISSPCISMRYCSGVTSMAACQYLIACKEAESHLLPKPAL